MNKAIRIRQTDTCKVWFSSDFHLNHNPKWTIPIWKDRGYNSVNEMNNAIINSINGCVNHTDILVFLGDFCLNSSESNFEEFITRINCQHIYMVFGNHNSCVWSIYQRELKKIFFTTEIYSQLYDFGDIEVYPLRYRNIVYLGNYAEISVDGKMFICSHFPIHSWNNQKQGTIHLHGHQHCKNNPQGGRRMDCGWDRDKRPYSANEIWNNLSKVPILSDGGNH